MNYELKPDVCASCLFEQKVLKVKSAVQVFYPPTQND
jgi:hypothetical protein